MSTLRIRGIPALAASLCAAACSSVTPLIVHDSAVFAPSGRVRVDLQRDAPGGWFVEGAFSDTEGDDRQGLASSHTVVVDNVTFTGPDTLDIDASLRVGELVVGSCVFRENVRFALYSGLQTIDLDLEVQGSSQRASDQRSSQSWLVGAEFSAPMRSWLTLDGRADISYSVSGDELAAQQFELGVGLLPVPYARVFVGLSYRTLTQVVAGASDIDLEFFGPALGLRLDV